MTRWEMQNEAQRGTRPHLEEQTEFKSCTHPRTGKSAEQLLVGMENAILEGGFLRSKSKTSKRPSDCAASYLPSGNQGTCPHRDCYMSFHTIFVRREAKN